MKLLTDVLLVEKVVYVTLQACCFEHLKDLKNKCAFYNVVGKRLALTAVMGVPHISKNEIPT